METLLLKPDEEALRRAGALIRAGKLVGFPTETVYGLGGDALDDQAVRDIFAAKGRPADNPLIVHISRPEQAEKLCFITPLARRLMDAFWPGPMTLLMKKKDTVPQVTTAGLPTVAVRCPDHPVALALIDAAGVPIAAPSGNLSGRPSPTTAAHMMADMDGRIPMILDGGACRVGVESTVVDATGDTPVVLRPGRITREQLAAAAGDCRVADSVMRPLKEGEAAPSPGMRHRHYAPRGAMTVVRGADAEKVTDTLRRMYDEGAAAGETVCILCHADHMHAFAGRRVESLGAAPEETAHVLFSALRDMDDQKITRILAEGWSEDGVGLAVMNRMARAAAFDVVDV